MHSICIPHRFLVVLFSLPFPFPRPSYIPPLRARSFPLLLGSCVWTLELELELAYQRRRLCSLGVQQTSYGNRFPALITLLALGISANTCCCPKKSWLGTRRGVACTARRTIRTALCSGNSIHKTYSRIRMHCQPPPLETLFDRPSATAKTIDHTI